MPSERSPLLASPAAVEPESLGTPAKTAALQRVSSFDLTRGLICLLMAIDHTFFVSGKTHPTESYAVHPDRHMPYISSWYQYGLRFVTHSCAPGFCILMGLGIVYFVESRVGRLGWSLQKAAKYIFIRGIIFILVGMVSTLPFHLLMDIKAWLIVDIILTLGVDFIIAGLLVLLIRKVESPKSRTFITATFGVLAILTACLTIALAPARGEKTSSVIEILWISGGTNTTWYMSRFPPLSWLPLVIYGIFFGRLTQDYPRRTGLLSAIAACLFFALFLAVRIPGKWGNLTPVGQHWFRRGPKEFLWTNKYCPDLAFITLFTSINHLFICIFTILPKDFPGLPVYKTQLKINTNQVLMDIGTSPFVFYFVHMWSLLGIGAALKASGLVWQPKDLGPGYQNPGLGNGWLFWLLYFIFVGYMWAICRSYGRFKSSKSADSPWRYF